MSKSNETPSSSPGGDRSASADVSATMAPDFEEGVRYFWEKNRGTILALVVVVLVAILVRHGWAMWQESQAAAARDAYAAAKTDSERQSFANAHAGTELAGAALLEVADKAYEEGRYSEAISGYDAAAAELEGTIFGDRVRLGRAVAQLRSGDETGGESALQAIANDTTVTGPVRGEAAFHLASRAAAAGDVATVKELATQISAIDPTSNWSQRVNMLQASLETAGDEAESESAISLPAL